MTSFETHQTLIDTAHTLAGQRTLNSPCNDNKVGSVACALVTTDGLLYTGISLVLQCGIGFCAEHAAVAEMVKHHKTQIKSIVSVKSDGTILPPCGRCRELLYQIDRNNLNTQIILDKDSSSLLKDLLPHPWKG